MFPFIPVISVLLRLKRTCPVCKRDQVVPARQRKQTVPCKFCGADVPPRKGVWCLTSTRVIGKLFINSVKMHLTCRLTRPAISSLIPTGRCLLSVYGPFLTGALRPAWSLQVLLLGTQKIHQIVRFLKWKTESDCLPIWIYFSWIYNPILFPTKTKIHTVRLASKPVIAFRYPIEH